MNWDEVAGKWSQFKGSAQEKWGELTDDDWQRIEGRREHLEGVIQERYGKTKEEASREVNEWLDSQERKHA